MWRLKLLDVSQSAVDAACRRRVNFRLLLTMTYYLATTSDIARRWPCSVPRVSQGVNIEVEQFVIRPEQAVTMQYYGSIGEKIRFYCAMMIEMIHIVRSRPHV